MRRLIIGSTAMWAHGVGNRQPKDLDTFNSNVSRSVPEEDSFWHPLFFDWLPEGTDRVATLDELYTIKVSHTYWELPNRSWNKHVYDLEILKQAGAFVDQELHDLLYKVWVDKHGKKVMDLAKEANDFFDDAVKRKYDHDSLHMSVAYEDRPIYEEVLKDGHSVAIDPRKQWGLPHERLVRMLREEIYVTALERLVIPSDYEFSPGHAHAWALRRTITSLTKGKTAQFLVENFGEFRKPDIDYVAHHLSKAHHLVEL